MGGGEEKLLRFQQWYLQCIFPSPFAERGQTWCSLRRTVYDNWSDAGKPSLADIGTIVIEHNNSLEEKTLIIRHADWKNGRLDLAVNYSTFDDENPTEVMIRLQYEKDSIFLDSFKAITIVRGSLSDTLSSVEYRIPEYDYTMRVPIQLRGMKSEAQRMRDTLFRSLSPKDSEIWRKLEPTVFDFRAVDEKAFSKKVLPEWDGKRELSPQENKELLRAMSETIVTALRKKLLTFGVSENGQKAILEFVRSAFPEN